MIMEKTIERKVAALTKKARVAVSSSLHQVIKTKEQAALFMKLLKEA
jgi:hypothetical protein